jgi:hypothetical protein
MPVYYFNLCNGGAGLLDQDGAELPDLDAAKAYAAQIARELMNRDEHKKRPGRLDVVDADGERVFEVPFAAVDPSLDHLEPELRALVERLCESERQLAETIFTERLLVMWNRETPPPVSPASPISRLCSVSGLPWGQLGANMTGGGAGTLFDECRGGRRAS